ncbi:hypothetical protein NM688_g6648 [Phlebia brevispora]|uniref:Uncharacterized protein n=1 Tax=Phlebia brevispora TaxID=194682 RepID=A0ACC1SDU7_9APHY|nr:hypothetical protein NM688_g6648 [Phlebia brevispora]
MDKILNLPNRNSRSKRQRPSLLNLWRQARRRKITTSSDAHSKPPDWEDSNLCLDSSIGTMAELVPNPKKRHQFKPQIFDSISKSHRSTIKPYSDLFYVDLPANETHSAPSGSLAISEKIEPPLMLCYPKTAPNQLDWKDERIHGVIATTEYEAKPYVSLSSNDKIQDVQKACKQLQRSGGCVVCFARGFVDWRSHTLSVCTRGVATREDHIWRTWRTDHLRVPSGVCSACCIPQNTVGGWHTFQTGTLSVNCCPTPDIVKPIAYALVHDPELYEVFSKTSLFSTCRVYDDYAAWLVKKPGPDTAFNILEAFLWLLSDRPRIVLFAFFVSSSSRTLALFAVLSTGDPAALQVVLNDDDLLAPSTSTTSYHRQCPYAVRLTEIMSEAAAHILREAKSLHNELKESLKHHDVSDREIEIHRKNLRRQYLRLLFLHPYARESKDAETLMWMQTSYSLIAIYKQRIAALDRAIQHPRQGQQSSHHPPRTVEYRKLLQRFRQFLAEEENPRSPR